MIRVFTLSQIYANGLAYDFFRILLAPQVQRVAQERAAEQAAQERAQEQERAAKAPKHVALSNDGPVKRGRSGPDFSM